MRGRPLTVLIAMAVVTLVLAGCDEALLEQHIQAKQPSEPVTSAQADRPSAQQPETVQLLLDAATVAGKPPPLAATRIGGLAARIQQAIDEAAAGGAALSVAVLDRKTRELVSNGNTQVIATASVAKLFIADDLLLQELHGKTTLSPDDRRALDIMLQSSDDDAAEKFWDQGGGDAIITQVAMRYGLPSTVPPGDGRWWNTTSSLTDLIHYYDKLLDGSGGLPADRAGIIVDNLSQSTPTGIDGYPQRFGIPDGLFGEPVAVKQGWMCCIGSDWLHLSTGVVGADHRYIVAVQSLQTTDDATARETITHAVKTMFPDGRI
jgi:hypothetical protein